MDEVGSSIFRVRPLLDTLNPLLSYTNGHLNPARGLGAIQIKRDTLGGGGEGSGKVSRELCMPFQSRI